MHKIHSKHETELSRIIFEVESKSKVESNP